MNIFENITFRRARSHSMSEILTDSDSQNSTLDGTTHNFPNISDENACEHTELKQLIDKLQSELCDVRKEISQLRLENSDLKKTINGITGKQEAPAQKHANDVKTPSKTPIRRASHTTKSVHKNQNGRKQKFSDISHPVATISSAPTTDSTERNIKQTIDSTEKQHRLCIISDNKANKILTKAMDVFLNYKICHYLTPNCGIKMLLTGLKSKLEHYTMDDYCVILIGSEDFKTTKNYIELIAYIRNSIKDIKNTNLIICLPTYKCNELTNMFNCRIENFNLLLCLDVMSHEYAYVVDSNLNLKCDYNMFHKRSGSISNNGVYTILNDVLNLITEIKNYNYDITVTSQPNSDQLSCQDIFKSPEVVKKNINSNKNMSNSIEVSSQTDLSLLINKCLSTENTNKGSKFTQISTEITKVSSKNPDSEQPEGFFRV